MRGMTRRCLLSVALCLVGACGPSQTDPDRGGAGIADAGPEVDAGGLDSGQDVAELDAGPIGDAGGNSDAGGLADGGEDGGCFLASGVTGQCLSTSDCTALGAYSSTPGYCPGPADIECCAPTPNVADNPPVPSGWQLMQQSAVTPAMTAWAVAILNAPATYPMFSTTTQTFGSLLVLARVEWHPPDFQNNAVHRGVTLYVPAA
jgi:hypothetical protein